MKNLIILIPPSEGKTPSGSCPPLKKVPQDVRHMLNQIKSVKTVEWPKILGVKGKTLELAMDANKKILSAPTLPAIERYTGVVYKAIDYMTLPSQAQQKFNKHVRIVSALFGLVEPDQYIPDYKLKIDKLGADKHWVKLTAGLLNGCFVLDLLPKAHKKAVQYTDGMSIEFIVKKGSKSVSAGHQGKHIKGRFIRWLVECPMISEDVFGDFTEDGFRWDGKAFVKKV